MSTEAGPVAFQHVFKAFGPKQVLRDVSFQVQPGETLCILGRSGTGKSVTLKLLMALLKPDQGSIWVDQDDITHLNEKGSALVLDAHALLRASSLNFEGNAESRDLLKGAADVIVTDGFTGNIALKLLEGTIREVLDALREEITATSAGKLGGLLIKPAARRLRTRLDPDTHGGAYLLGLKGLAVIAHGNSSARAIANAIRLAARGVDHQVVERLAERLPQRVGV